MYLHACTYIIMYELSMFTQCIIMYSLIRIFHIYEQIFLAIDQRGSDNRGCTVTLALLQAASMIWTLNGKHKLMVT